MPSTVIRSFHYHPGKRVLQVIFISGSIYEYLGVPEEVYHAMKASSSKGEFLNRTIKKAYDFRRIK
ncbi:MAG TPA: KTSC domain-containing protein [Chitinophagales bacterium]|nr:KTSC domain-containing protein [Chitinophagales bacterium]